MCGCWGLYQGYRRIDMGLLALGLVALAAAWVWAGRPTTATREVYIRGQGLDAVVIQSMLSEGSSIIQNEGTIIVCLLSQSLHCS